MVLGSFPDFCFLPLLNKSVNFSLPMDLFWLCREMNKTRKQMFFLGQIMSSRGVMQM